MKKLKAVIFSLGLISTLLSAGCAGKGSLEQSTEGKSGELQIELFPITSVREHFSEDANALKIRLFDNISFENIYFSFTEANELFTLEYKITNFDVSPDDAYNFMCKKLDELFPGQFSDEKKEKEIRFYDVSLINSENEQRFNEYPTLEQYKAMQEKGYPYLLTNHATTGINNAGGYTNERYLDVMNGVLWGFDDGYLAKASGFDRNLSSFDILSNFPVIYRTENLESGKTFHLSSGDISIADAVKSAEKCLSELELSERKLPLKMRVQNINVSSDSTQGTENFTISFEIFSVPRN